MARIILHSDDFGLHDKINQAVTDAAEYGVLTSCSLMANGMAADEAVKRALRIPQLGVGIHLNILRGMPLSDPETIPSLVDGNGRFFNSAAKMASKSMLGKISSAEIYSEYRRQIEFMIQNNLVPTHIDSEKHSHLWLPQAAKAVKQVMMEFGIYKIRMVKETPILKALHLSKINMRASYRQLLKLVFLEYRSGTLKKSWKHCASPDYFFGVGMSGRFSDNQPGRILKNLFQLKKNKVIEWMFHLSYDATRIYPEIEEGFGKYYLNGQRQTETQMLLSEDFIEQAKIHNRNLISYREL